MNNNNQQPFYLFLHIPKTAGTTLRHLVDQAYGPENVITYYNQNSTQLLENLDAHLKVHPKFKAFIGHFTFGLHDKIDRPAKYITFLRHPVARTISHYKETLVNHRQHLQASDGSILSLLDSLERNPEFYEDYQTKHIVGNDPKYLNDASISDIALEILEKYFCGLGLVEYFESSIALIAQNLGWRSTEYQKHNVKELDVEMTPELIEKINSLNKNDLVIYEAVEKKLIAEFDRLPAGLRSGASQKS